MKKIIVTLCSLALSCVGTFGINQLVSNDQLTIDKTNEQAIIEQAADETEDKAALPNDSMTSEENAEKEDKASEAEVVAPKAKDAVKEEIIATNKKDNSTVKNTADDKKTVSSNNTINNTSKKNSANAAKQNTATKNTNSTNAGSNKTTSNNTSNATKNTSNGNVKYIYKNIDLSDCKSTAEVVQKLQKNGYTNINSGNINNIGSLDEILSLIGEKNSGSNNNTKTPANTTTPKDTNTNKGTTTNKPSETTTNNNTTSTNTNTSNSLSIYAQEVLRLVNVERAKAGLSALTTNTTLKSAADKRAQETSVSFSHTRPNGSKFSTVLQEYGISYRTAGENIAYGQRTPQDVVNAWMNSAGHRANILNSSFNKIGIGVYQKNGVIYWSQLFTN